MSDDDMEGELRGALPLHAAQSARCWDWDMMAYCMCVDYGFEYSDEEVVEDDVDIENQYYNSKGALRASCCCKPTWVHKHKGGE